MAMNDKNRDLQLLFWMRLAGLTGLLIVGAGVVLIFVKFIVAGILVLVLGGALAIGAAVVEMKGIVDMASGRRGALASNLVLQVLLAVILLAGVNVFSFLHYKRLDWTRGHQFTIPAKIQEQLSELRGETTVVIYLPHRTFGQQSGQQADPEDIEYDTEAERKTVEKIKDLVEEFQELGPQFKVLTLDVNDKKGYRSQLAELTSNYPDLRAVIDRSPVENSIFFYASDKVQRLGFQDIYQLDRTASRSANDGKGNLVLLNQGVEPFANKVLNIEERRPRVAIAVVHELLTTEGTRDEYTLAGVKKALLARRFEVRDLILKRWSRFGPPQPAVYTYDESKFEKLAEKIDILDVQTRLLEKQVQDWKSASEEELKKRKLTQRDREEQIAVRELYLEQFKKEKQTALDDQQRLGVESMAEQRRLADPKAKMSRALADCDLLILPRLTLTNVTTPFNIPNSIHKLDDAQLEAVRDFLKAGKPVLFCLGPINESPEEPPSFEPDNLEMMLERLGVRLGRQTVLFDNELGALAEHQASAQAQGGMSFIMLSEDVKVPPASFEKPGDKGKANPLRESLRLAARSLGKNQVLDLRIRHPRPISFDALDAKPGSDPEFMLTDAASWVEDQPYPTEKYLPRYDEKKKRGPVSIGIAAEVSLPPEWSSDKDKAPATKDRIAVIGQPSVFVGTTLPPASEKLLLDVSNWLLGRDDLLTKGDMQWQYPRVSMSERQQQLWLWGARLGLPVLFIYFGMVVLMVRRLR